MKKNRFKRIILYILIILIVLFFINFNKKYTIKEYNNVLGGIIEKVLEKNPDISEEDIVSILNSQKSNLNLEKYGIYNDEYISENSNKVLIFTTLSIILLLILIIESYIYFENRKIKKNINIIIEDIEKISKGNYDINLSNEEGDFSKMQNTLYKVSSQLKSESMDYQAQKEVLKNNLEDISHQIKTPLTSINLLIENLQDDQLDVEIKKELLEDMKNEVDAITNLILILLKISTIEAKSRPFNRKNIYIKDLISSAEKILKPIIDKNSIELIKDFSNESILGDFNWEKEAYINLIKNAIEHGIDNKIYISVKDTNTYIQVDISNKGENIPISEQRRIFDRFYKRSESDTNFGIGLNLCKLIVEEDNGKIQVISKNGFNTFRIKYFKSNII